jgi:hypothetical protein
MPIFAVSASRISPTMMTSGSARKNARMAAAKVQSILGWRHAYHKSRYAERAIPPTK